VYAYAVLDPLRNEFNSSLMNQLRCDPDMRQGLFAQYHAQS
jgi:hypothetical protein